MLILVYIKFANSWSDDINSKQRGKWKEKTERGIIPFQKQG